MHSIWLELAKDAELGGLHHYHVVALALRELQHRLDTNDRQELLQKLSHDVLGIAAGPYPTNDTVSLDKRF
jgi:hypothetical protein